MPLEQQLEFSLRLMLSITLSGVIGMDRERRDKSAGLRTHILVGVGACLITILSIAAFPGGDPTRVASSIVTGVGFLGAGVIWRGKNRVHDLTTAASIWVTAAIGMAVGVGAWLLAVIITLLVWFTLRVLYYTLHRNQDMTQDTQQTE
jgi:putative Mg2+ transporter-C (MgtC) family protein